MPTYQYACKDCGHSFEQFQSFSDAALTVCPVCEGRLRKVFNAVGVVFKGSGFYRTDSRSDARNGNGSSSASENGSASTTSEKAAAGSSSSDGGSSDSTSSGGSSSASGSAAKESSSSTPTKGSTSAA